MKWILIVTYVLGNGVVTVDGKWNTYSYRDCLNTATTVVETLQTTKSKLNPIKVTHISCTLENVVK